MIFSGLIHTHFYFYKNNAYKNMRLRFGPNFWGIFLNTIDIQNRITQKESTHSKNHFEPIFDR